MPESDHVKHRSGSQNQSATCFPVDKTASILTTPNKVPLKILKELHRWIKIQQNHCQANRDWWRSKIIHDHNAIASDPLKPNLKLVLHFWRSFKHLPISMNGSSHTRVKPWPKFTRLSYGKLELILNRLGTVSEEISWLRKVHKHHKCDNNCHQTHSNRTKLYQTLAHHGVEHVRAEIRSQIVNIVRSTSRNLYRYAWRKYLILAELWILFSYMACQK